VPHLDSGYASKPKKLASVACGYLQGITVFLSGKKIEYFLPIDSFLSLRSLKIS
jgi:hypothetical protein